MSLSLSVIELRQYTLHPGRRDDLIALFEREFVEPQEALGIAVLGTFRDLDAPDRFVWLRGSHRPIGRSGTSGSPARARARCPPPSPEPLSLSNR